MNLRLTVLFVGALALGVAAALLVCLRPSAPPPSPAPPTPPAPSAPLPVPATPLVDVTATSGITFVHECGAAGEFWAPETIGAGGALFDADGDDDLDLFLVQGGALPDGDPAHTSRLYLNDGRAHFHDATDAAHAAVGGYGMGATAADIDADGDVDLYVTRLGRNVLLVNRGDGTFEDGSARSGLDDPGWGTAAAFYDFDRDGHLDLFLGNYLDWSPAIEHRCTDGLGARDYCIPLNYGVPAQSRLFRGGPAARFTDITKDSGLEGTRGNALGLAVHDVSGDGWLDVYVACDQTPGQLWINQRDGTFRDEARARGAAVDATGRNIAGMGTANDDIDGDLDIDLVVTNIQFFPHLALAAADGVFTNAVDGWGLPAWAIRYTGFGLALFDADHDGDLDGVVANGAVQRLLYPYRPDHEFAEPDQFLRQDGAPTLRDATAEIASVPGFSAATSAMSRSVLKGDLDNDGDLDLVVTANRGSPRIYLNTCAPPTSWTLLDVRSGGGKATALGAVARIEAGGRRWIRLVAPTSGYLGTHDARVHAGLAGATTLDAVDITWPDGARERWEGLPVSRRLRLVQGESPRYVEVP